MSHVVLVLTTVASEALAEAIATVLLTERLAACVNVGAPMTSIYRWKGIVERETERQLVIKTMSDRVTVVEQRLKELHSYELPEFLVVDVAGGSDENLKWVETESRALTPGHDGTKANG
jgi:periplasmic divalent cation tolerance protein